MQRDYAWSSLFAGGVSLGVLGAGAESVTGGGLGGIALSVGAVEGVDKLDEVSVAGGVLDFTGFFAALWRAGVAMASCFEEADLLEEETLPGTTGSAAGVACVVAGVCWVSAVAAVVELSLEDALSALGAGVAGWLKAAVFFTGSFPTS